MSTFQSGKREFKLLSANGDVLGTYTGSYPSQAAMKAASRGHDSIMLREHYGGSKYAPKVYMYQGSLRPLSANERTGFAAQHNIKFKPEVVRVGTMNRGDALGARGVQRLGQKDGDGDDYEMSEEEKRLEMECDKVTQDEVCAKPCIRHPTSGKCYLGGDF